MQSWQIGRVEVTRVVDAEVALPAVGLIPEASPQALVADESWLCPHFVDAAGQVKLSIHTFAVRTGDMRIVVDTCLGPADKHSGPLRAPTEGSPSFLDGLEAVGFSTDAVDRVLCTHLHFDHVGWNTLLRDGRWMPTFPNARYLMGRNEWEFWTDHDDDIAPESKNQSVLPLLEAGLVDLVDTDHRLTDEVTLIPTPGHTPGHVSVLIDSGGEQAIITGDSFHNPLQFAHPDWRDVADVDDALARETRERFIRNYADTSVTILGTHFAAPTAGHIRSRGDSHWFQV